MMCWVMLLIKARYRQLRRESWAYVVTDGIMKAEVRLWRVLYTFLNALKSNQIFCSGNWHNLCQDVELQTITEKTCGSWNGSEQILQVGGTWITESMKNDCNQFISLMAPILHPSLDPHPVSHEILQCSHSAGRAPSCRVGPHNLLTCCHF